MKKVMIIALVCSICLATSACSAQTTESTGTASSTTQNVIETTKATEKPTEKPTEPPTETIEYTAIELAGKSINEIKALMDDDYKSEHIQLSNAFSSDGCQYIYNNDKLPGFAFAVGDDDYYGISIMNGAKLNDKISSDMDYKQIADIVGDMEGMLVAQENNICCYAEVDGYQVVFCFIDNDYTRENRSGGNLSSSVLRSGNPSLQSIGLRKEKPSDPEPETERQKTENSFGMSDEEIKSMLTSDRWILREVYVDGEPYQGNFYGSITTQTGAYIEFKNDSTFNCVLGFVCCSGTFSISDGAVTMHTTQEIVGDNFNDLNETQELGWKGDGTILFNYGEYEAGQTVTNAFHLR